MIARLKCLWLGHSLYLHDIGKRDDAGYLLWPCQRCGHVQHIPYGLVAKGTMTNQRLGGKTCT